MGIEGEDQEKVEKIEKVELEEEKKNLPAVVLKLVKRKANRFPTFPRQQYKFRIKKKEYDPWLMDAFIYNLILNNIKLRKLKSDKAKEFYVNTMLPARPDLWHHFNEYAKIVEFNEKVAKNQRILDELNKILDDMKDTDNFGRELVSKKKKPREGSEEDKYQKEFEYFDSNIDKIMEWIVLCVPPKRIVYELKTWFPGLSMTAFYYWKDWTKHGKKLAFAYKCSGEEHMHLSQEFMLNWLNSPRLDMQHVGIVREIGLYHSRMAEFLDRKKWGRKVEITNEKPAPKMISGRDLTKFLEGITDAAEKVNSSEEKEEVADFEEVEFEDSEEEGNQEDKED